MRSALYNKFKDEVFDAKAIEKETALLVLDDDVSNKKGIYPYILTRDEKHLNIRAFTQAMKIKVFELQGCNCPICGKHFELGEMEADHITPWCEGGKTDESNCQLLCKDCNRRKSSK